MKEILILLAGIGMGGLMVLKPRLFSRHRWVEEGEDDPGPSEGQLKRIRYVGIVLLVLEALAIIMQASLLLR